MNMFCQIFFIFTFNLIITLCKVCNLSDSICRYDNVTLECYGNHSLYVTDEDYTLPVYFQPFQQFFNDKISKLNLKYVCLKPGDLDRFDSLKTLELSEEPHQYLDENIFSPKLGSTLLELQLNGHYLFSSALLKNLKNLTTLTFTSNWRLESMLTKEFFSDSLSNLKFLQLSFSYISILDGDMFINLKNLETLKLYFNSIKEFPKAIQYIPSLKDLYINQIELEVLKKPFSTILHNLHYLKLSDNRNLKSIENCVFCNFPNLRLLNLNDNKNLTWIHENAFGSLLTGNDDHLGYKIDNLEYLYLEDSNLSILPENLLNWSKLKHIFLDGNKLICNCSNARLIEEIKSKNPAFTNNYETGTYVPYKSEIKCYGPENVKGKALKEISTEDCKKKVSANSMGAFWFFIGFLLAAALMIVITVIIFRQRIIEFYERTKSNIEHIKLNEYSDS